MQRGSKRFFVESSLYQKTYTMKTFFVSFKMNFVFTFSTFRTSFFFVVVVVVVVVALSLLLAHPNNYFKFVLTRTFKKKKQIFDKFL